jgi:hypothetical protein
MRRTLAMRIGNSITTPTYEWNLLDALMNHERFDVFDYIMDELWNIAIKPQRSCGFAPYIMCMIEVVAHERFYKDVAHEPLRSIVPKDPRSHHTSSAPLAVGPTRTTHSGGASSSSSSNSSFLKMFWGIFAMCRHTDQHMDMVKQRLEIVHHIQEIIHSQQNEPLLEFPDAPVYPSALDPYALLTLAELAAFGIGPSCAPANYDDDEEVGNDDEETEDDK